MGIGLGVILIVAGAVLMWALNVDLSYVDDDTLGFEQSFFRHAVTLGVAPMRASNGAGNEALR